MSLADYVNRRYDYLGFRGVKARGDNKLGLALYADDSSGQICVGVQKLAQRWALEFLTEAGSMPGLPERGSPFMISVRNNTLRSSLDVGSAFLTAGLTIERNLKNEEYDTMPDDERFVSANLTSMTFYPGYLELHVQINSRAGTSRAIILPISTLP